MGTREVHINGRVDQAQTFRVNSSPERKVPKCARLQAMNVWHPDCRTYIATPPDYIILYFVTFIKNWRHKKSYWMSDGLILTVEIHANVHDVHVL